MRRSKVFLKKNKRGNILKVVREHYLRNDIVCGSMKCDQCRQQPDSIVLSDRPTSLSNVFPFAHYLLLDTNVILDQIHIFEESVLKNVIILHTVLNEVRHRSSMVYKSLLNILENPDRHFYLFVNEHHRDTYVERNIGETMNNRNDRAIRKAAVWYDKHLSSEIRVILLTDDANNRNAALGDGLISCSVGDYVASISSHMHLQDKLARKSFDTEHGKTNIFPSHITPSQIHARIKNGTLHQGTFHASNENYLEGSVNIENFDKSVLVQGLEGLNRAVDGDIVAVEVYPKEMWKNPSGLVLQDDDQDDESSTFNQDSIESDCAPVADRLPTGRIIGIIRRKWRQYCGILQSNNNKGTTWHLFVPSDRKVPKVRISTRQADQMHLQRIIVTIDTWPANSRYPIGHYVRTLGPLGDKQTENEVLLIEHDVPHSKFSEEVLRCLPIMPWRISDQEIADRVDLRGLTICSVDPPGCTDIDDALHCRRLSNGRFEVGVHIADVSHFIKQGNAMDKEAANRGTTVYLVDKRIDMVPELLSSNLCSLKDNVDRLAFSCVWELDDEANILATRFHKSVIRSKKSMTYEEAQLIIDDVEQQTDIAATLRQLNRLAKELKKQRIEKGALVLASPEIRFQIDDETHEPLDVEAKQVRDTNAMVEEFMLLANVSVAERIHSEFPDCALLRRHPEPTATNFEPLVKAAAVQGFNIETSSGKQLARSLDAAVRSDNVYLNTLLRILATRCMMQAVYFISGTMQVSEYHHYGLAAPIYTHFTSPIRRYADIIVHRLLSICIGANSSSADLLDKRHTSTMCNNLNYRNRMAQYAGRASVALNTHLFFNGRQQVEDGFVLFVRKNALQILIPKFGLEGIIYVIKKQVDANMVQFTYNPEEHTQECCGIIFRSFDAVKVRLSIDSSNVQHEKLVLELVEPFIPGFSVREP